MRCSGVWLSAVEDLNAVLSITIKADRFNHHDRYWNVRIGPVEHLQDLVTLDYRDSTVDSGDCRTVLVIRGSKQIRCSASQLLSLSAPKSEFAALVLCWHCHSLNLQPGRSKRTLIHKIPYQSLTFLFFLSSPIPSFPFPPLPSLVFSFYFLGLPRERPAVSGFLVPASHNTVRNTAFQLKKGQTRTVIGRNK